MPTNFISSVQNRGRHSDGILRQCSRCHAELTDAASRECGVGPICRGKDNAIFARQMNANVTVAAGLFLSITEADVPWIWQEALEVRELFLDKLCYLQVNNDDLTNLNLPGADFRSIVDWIDYSLSFGVSRRYRELAIAVIDNLGYKALAGVLRGDVCMSPAKLWIEDGQLKLSGKSCKAGFLALRRIPGIKLPRYRGDKTPYSCDVAHAERFIELALKHWPFMEEGVNTDALKAEARQIRNTRPDITKYETPTKPIATFRPLINGWFMIKTPWIRDGGVMAAMNTKFKEINKNERRYNPISYSWEFKSEHKDRVLSIISPNYFVHVEPGVNA